MIKLKEFKEFHFNGKLLSMKKSPELKEFQSKEQSLTTTLSRHKFNTFLRRLRRQLSSMNQSKESGKEYNIYQSRHKSFIIQKGITTLLVKVNISVLVMLKVDTLQLEPLMFHLKAESEQKLYTKLDLFHPHQMSFKDQLSGKDLYKEPLNMVLEPLNMVLEPLMEILLTVQDQSTRLDSKDIPLLGNKVTPLDNKDIPPLDNKATPLPDNKIIQLDIPMSLEEVESEAKLFTNNHKLEPMLLEEVESDNDYLISSYLHFFIKGIFLPHIHSILSTYSYELFFTSFIKF